MTFTKEEHALKIRQLERAEHSATVTGLDGTVWYKDWDDMWYSDKPYRVNSAGLVHEFNPSQSKDKNADKGMSLFDMEA